jgi:hypothetical protein
MSLDEAGTHFLDGMRVSTEHMRHLQQSSVERARQLRSALGGGGVCHGYKVEPGNGGEVRILPGLAFDAQGRPLRLEQAATLPAPQGRRWLVAQYELRSSLLVNGVPTLLADGVQLQARESAPPYDDAAVAFAEVARSGDAIELLQKGEWYLPPLVHGHRGGFVTDAQGLWRYDGAAVGGGLAPHYDSGFVALAAGEAATLAHGLQSLELIIDLTARRADGVLGNRGIGSDWWFELPDADHLVIARAAAAAAPPLALRARAWRPEGGGAAPMRPIADAGDDRSVGVGESFPLDASRSRALGGQHLVRYRWTLMS